VPGKAKLAFAGLRASPAVLSMIGPSLKKNKTMEAPQNRRFYFEE
jgi:hypothetical protein